MKKIFTTLIASLIIILNNSLLGSAPQDIHKTRSVIGAIWAPERYVCCAFYTGRHADITVTEELPEVPSPFIYKIQALKNRGDKEIPISMDDRLMAKYSGTMKTMYALLNASHKKFERLMFVMYTDGSVKIDKYFPKK
jgi:hypothetical protein